MSKFDRLRAEALNADHHVRMRAEAGRRVRPPTRDAESRALIVEAMLGCVNRYGMRAPGDDGQLRVLELGAGFGGDRQFLCDAFAAAYLGIEVVEAVAATSDDVRYMAIEEMPEEWNGTFHFVYSRHVMEHVLDLPQALAAIKRVLAPNGVLGAVTPHYFPDPEPAHVTQLRISEWMTAYERSGLRPVYAVEREFECAEAHIVCVHSSYELNA
jgi:SAM-dependent methyltransferase